MMDNMQRSYWDSNSNLHVNYEGSHLIDENSQHKEERGIFPCCESNLNFSTATCSEDDLEYGKCNRNNKNTRQDPMSHRIIEKRRRDRMNNCLADLSRLIPTEYLKKGRGRIEKTEIIEMAIKHMKFLQQDSDPSEQFRLGYQECMSETMRFMVEVEGHFSNEAICVRLLTHLQKHCANLPHRSSHVPPNIPVTDRLMGPVPAAMERSPIEVPEFQTMKVEIEQNNNNAKDNTMFNNNTFSTRSNNEDSENGHTDNGRISYKYKTNIKLRFNQDLNGESEAKRPKLNGDRRNSVNSIENRSMSHSSPPASEACTRISDTENTNRTSPSDSTLSSNQLKIESASSNEITNPCSPHEPSLHSLNVKNFKVPIFMLHTKGSFYVPLTVDYKALIPYLPSYEISDEVILHPVTINVNFQPSFNHSIDTSKYKNDYMRNTWQ